jgi:tellurite resistance protein TerC
VQIDVWMWAAFGVFVVAMLVVDFVAFGAQDAEVPFRRAVVWSIGWTALGLAFAAFMLAWEGRTPAVEYLTGFLIEKSLSVDNLFVFALILGYFAVPPELHRRAVFWGIVGAVVLRGIFIAAGATLLNTFHYTVYVFGAFLVLTGIRMVRSPEIEIHPERNPALRLLQRILPVATRFEGNRLVITEGGRRYATPLLAALGLIAAFDLVFAVDSIPAIFAVTDETFIVYAANAFSLLGLGALYFVLAGMLGRFRFLPYGLAAILVFIGLKMVLEDVVHVSSLVSLLVVVGVLAIAVVLSLLRPGSEEAGEPAPHPRLDDPASASRTGTG